MDFCYGEQVPEVLTRCEPRTVGYSASELEVIPRYSVGVVKGFIQGLCVGMRDEVISLNIACKGRWLTTQ